MVITLDPDLDTALRKIAKRQGVAPETFALNALREKVLSTTPLLPRDEWERGLLAAARHCGVAIPDAALSREGLPYD